MQPPKPQRSKAPLQFTPSIGMPILLLNKDIYKSKRVNFGQQAGLEIKKYIGKHLSVSLEGQYRLLNLQRQVNENYRNYIQSLPSFANIPAQYIFKPFQPSTIMNGIVSLHYNRHSKNKKNMWEAGIGGGIQHYEQGRNYFLAFRGGSNTLVTGYDTLYVERGGRSRSAIIQASLQNTYWFSECVGIRLGALAQYTQMARPITFTYLPQNVLFTSGTIYEVKTINRHPTFTLIPSIGITFRPGACKQPNTNNDTAGNNSPCFALQWKNPPPQDSCLRADSAEFAIQYPAGLTNVIGYEIYLAREDDLNHPKLLFSLAYPATKFYVHSGLLEAMQYYRVFVKLLYRQQPEKNCLQTSPSIWRCTNCCLDSGKQLKG